MTTRHENRCVMAIDFMISAPKHYKVTKGSGLTVTFWNTTLSNLLRLPKMTNTTVTDGYVKGVHRKQGKRYGEINDNKDEIDNLFRPMTFFPSSLNGVPTFTISYIAWSQKLGEIFAKRLKMVIVILMISYQQLRLMKMFRVAPKGK